MDFDARPEPAIRLEFARTRAGFSTAKDAARRFGWVYETYIQHEQGTRGLTRAAEKYAKAFKVSQGWLLTGEGRAPNEGQAGVPLLGYVGAGQAVEAIDQENGETVEPPADWTPDTVSVEVAGDSMFPAYEPGTLLYYSKLLPPVEMVNKRAVVQLGDGRIFVKIIRRGTTDTTWTLQSLNAQFPDMVDEVVEWAAPIDWIKPR